MTAYEMDIWNLIPNRDREISPALEKHKTLWYVKIILPEERITDNNPRENLSSYTVLPDVLYVREIWNYFHGSSKG
jgi:hypothetical protein